MILVEPKTITKSTRNVTAYVAYVQTPPMLMHVFKLGIGFESHPNQYIKKQAQYYAKAYGV